MTKRKIVKTAAAIAMSLVIAITPQVGVKAASVVSVTGDGVENGGAVVKPGADAVFFAGSKKVRHNVAFTVFPGCAFNAVVMFCRRPQAKAGAMLGNKHRIASTGRRGGFYPVIRIERRRVKVRSRDNVSPVTPEIIPRVKRR